MTSQQLYERIKDGKPVDDLLPTPRVNDLYHDFTPLCYAIYRAEHKTAKMLLAQENIDVERRNGEKPKIADVDFEKWRYKFRWDVAVDFHRAESEAVANRTPLEIAKRAKDEKAIKMLKRKINEMAEEERRIEDERKGVETKTRLLALTTLQPHSSQKRKTESISAAEKKQATNTQRMKAIEIIKDKSPEEIRELMYSGDIPIGVWKLKNNNADAAKLKSISLFSQTKANEKKLEQVENEIRNLTKTAEELRAEIQHDKHLLEEQRIYHYIKPLADCESECISSFQSKFNTPGWTFQSMNSADLAVFLNLLDLPHLVPLFVQVNAQTNGCLPKFIANQDVRYILFSENITLSDAKIIQFGIGMLNAGQFPPYYDHILRCCVCKCTPQKLIQSFDLHPMDPEVVESLHIHSHTLIYLEMLDLYAIFREDQKSAVKLYSTISVLREQHLAQIPKVAQKAASELK